MFKKTGFLLFFAVNIENHVYKKKILLLTVIYIFTYPQQIKNQFILQLQFSVLLILQTRFSKILAVLCCKNALGNMVTSLQRLVPIVIHRKTPQLSAEVAEVENQSSPRLKQITSLRLILHLHKSSLPGLIITRQFLKC